MAAPDSPETGEDRLFWADDSACVVSAQQVQYELADGWESRPAAANPALPAGLLHDRRKAVEPATRWRGRPLIVAVQPEV